MSKVSIGAGKKRGYASNCHYLSHNAVVPPDFNQPFIQQRMAPPVSGTIKGLSHRYTKNNPIAGYKEELLHILPSAGNESPIRRQMHEAQNFDLSTVSERQVHNQGNYKPTSFIDTDDLDLNEIQAAQNNGPKQVNHEVLLGDQQYRIEGVDHRELERVGTNAYKSPNAKGKYPLYSSLSKQSAQKQGRNPKHLINKSMGDVGRGILKTNRNPRASSVLRGSKLNTRFRDEEQQFQTVRQSQPENRPQQL